MAVCDGGSLRLGLRMLVVTLAFAQPARSAPEPRAATWSSKTFGPDGPWNAVEVSLGGQGKIALFPGRMWHTFVTTSNYCALNASVPHCEAGTYAPRTSQIGKLVQYKPPPQQLMYGIQVAGGPSDLVIDTVDILYTTDGEDAVAGATIALLDSQMLAYPDGTRYPIFSGCLSLGAPEVNQTFVRPGSPPFNGTITPWALASRGITPSSSFGLHIGSGATGAAVPGSLFFGGYDPTRVVGDVLTLEGDISNPVLLKDISITVINGSSPFAASFNGSSQPGLLAHGNASISASAGLPVILDPCTPYLTLPKSTCDSIAAQLPVTYSAPLGLYL